MTDTRSEPDRTLMESIFTIGVCKEIEEIKVRIASLRNVHINSMSDDCGTRLKSKSKRKGTRLSWSVLLHW